jgi:Sulfotransferase family
MKVSKELSAGLPIENMEGNQGQNLVFIVGCPRSGTTWLQKMVSSHPKIRTGPESHVFLNYIGPQLRKWRHEIRALQDRPSRFVGLSAYFSDSEFRTILRGYMFRLLAPMIADLEPGEIFLEKTPGHAFCINEIMEMLPKSRIIHIVRDARDVVASILNAGESWARESFPTNPSDAAEIWVDHVKAVRAAMKRVPKGQFYELTYENLYCRTEDLLSDVWRFIGVESTLENVTNATRTNAANELRRDGAFTFSVGGEIASRRGPIAKVPQGFIGSPEPGRWKKDLSAYDKMKVWRVARKTMASNGYLWKLPL